LRTDHFSPTWANESEIAVGEDRAFATTVAAALHSTIFVVSLSALGDSFTRGDLNQLTAAQAIRLGAPST
jgi:hypothetical protein